MCKKPLVNVGFDEHERALNLRAKLLWRRQLAAVDDDDKSAGEAIGK